MAGVPGVMGSFGCVRETSGGTEVDDSVDFWAQDFAMTSESRHT